MFCLFGLFSFLRSNFDLLIDEVSIPEVTHGSRFMYLLFILICFNGHASSNIDVYISKIYHMHHLGFLLRRQMSSLLLQDSGARIAGSL